MSEQEGTTQEALEPTQNAAPQLPEGVVLKDGKLFIETKVNNELKQLPFDEARIRLQKELAVEDGFQKNAETRKQLETQQANYKKAIEFYELSQKAMFQNDEDAGRRALQLMGYDVEEPDEAPPNAPQNSGLSKEDREALQTLRELQASGIDLREVGTSHQKSKAEEIRNRVYSELDAAVGQDSSLAALMKNPNAAGEVREMLRNTVGRMIGREGKSAGASTYASAIQETKDRLTKLGTLKDAQPATPSPYPGMGPSYSGVGFVEALQPAKRPEPISPIGNKNKYAQNLMERWAFDLHNGG